MMTTRMTYDEIAAWLTMSVRDVRRKVADGSIPAKRAGRRVLFDPVEVWAALPSAGRARRAGLPPSSALRRPSDLAAALKYKAEHWCDPPPDELAARRKQKEGSHGT